MLPENRTVEEKESLLKDIKLANLVFLERFKAERKRYVKMRALLKAYEQRVYQ